MLLRGLPANIQIEELTPKRASDTVQPCLNIDEECFEERLRYDRRYLYKLITTDKVLIARDTEEDEIVGYLIYRQVKNVNEIISIGVAKDNQRSHVGAALIAKLNAMDLDVTLMCRPYNEPFYRKQGFVAEALPTYYHRNYYQYSNVPKSGPSVAVHGIFMRNIHKNNLPPKVQLPYSNVIHPGQPEFEEFRTKLLAIARKSKNATSIFYGSWLAGLFRSRRKEKAFDAIINELNAIGSAATMNRKINPAAILQSIIFNALMVRGIGLLTKQTTSGKALVKLLNTPEFVSLRDLIFEGAEVKGAVTYQTLQDFCQMKQLQKSDETPKPYSPYRHF